MVEVKNLTKRFGQFTAVDNVSFTINPGEMFAFLGPNGAGKSTTIKILTTLLEPTSGSATVAGYDVVHDRDRVRSSFGIVFQDPSLDDDMTALENMQLHAALYNVPHRDRAPRIEQLLRLVDLWDRRKSLVRTFSGGMKRRLEIARSFLHTPRVLFLDEPTLGLDPQTRLHLWNHVRTLNRENKLTVLFTTHIMEEAQANADRICVIDHGKIVAMGTADELKAQTGKENLEQAFIDLTGHTMRDQEAGTADQFRQMAKVWGRR